jgi:hydrophobic/amphiphilic exporter-1 (mainly G- bacteria), HAE1 family
MVTLAGVVVNDSIVLVDFINQCIEKGMRPVDAIINAGSRRLRAVFLTSVTTVAGLLPMLLEKSFQAQALIPMATSLAFGLIGSTVLVLLMVPLLYRLYVAVSFTDEQMLGFDSETRVPLPKANSYSEPALGQEIGSVAKAF